MSRKKHHEKHHEEHIDETWLIPYADLLTLLLALFIVLFASSQVDQKKFDRMANSFSAAFSSGSPAILDSSMSTPSATEDPPAGTEKEQAYLKETAQLLEVKRVVDKYINDNNLAGDLQTALTEDGLLIRIKDTALFPSGSAELLPESRRIGAAVSQLLVPLQQKIIVSGHTDNVPINTREFPSNWELSSKRSLNFMKFIISQDKLQPERFSAIGYGEYRPVAGNDSVDGRAKNRRVEVLISRTYRQ
ncbi:flagellar motor protein MotB [Sporomusaceae bacterium FL31]|nr:flagellar motor protein MotB [Sporomusaceae bacterium FL31]GCE35393.1 flagellar motor protein MotB [Sporomusaceae bacterium]